MKRWKGPAGTQDNDQGTPTTEGQTRTESGHSAEQSSLTGAPGTAKGRHEARADRGASERSYWILPDPQLLPMWPTNHLTRRWLKSLV